MTTSVYSVRDLTPRYFTNITSVVRTSAWFSRISGTSLPPTLPVGDLTLEDVSYLIVGQRLDGVVL